MNSALDTFMNLGKGSLEEKESDLYVEKCMDILDRFQFLMESKGLNQKELAEKMGKREPEISKWLNGVQNFTLKTLCKLEIALGDEIISIPKHFVTTRNVPVPPKPISTNKKLHRKHPSPQKAGKQELNSDYAMAA